MAYLDQHSSKIPQQRVPRRGKIRHIIVHTTEQPPDLVGEDVRAEQLAKYLLGSTRAGSYHKVTDRDSVVVLVEDGNEAFGAQGGWNETALHVSIATQADGWATMPAELQAQYGLQAAQVVADWCRKYGIPPRRIEADKAQTGILGHGHVDPARRHDPGWNDSQWAAFIATVRQIVEGAKPVCIVEAPGRFWAAGQRWPLWRIYSDGRVVGIDGAPATEQLTDFGVARPDKDVSDAWWDSDTNRLVLYSEGDGGTFALAVKA